MLKHVIGLMRPDAGEVWYGDQRIDRTSERNLSPIRRQFGFLFQHSALFDSFTVADNVAFPLVEHTKLSAAERRERVAEVLDLMGLADMLRAMPAELSGGQRKRIALARAIVLEPSVILYDEPTTGLDPIRSEVINDLILRLQSRMQVSSIVVTHDLNSAFKIADRMVMLYDGRVVKEGLPQDFRQSEDPLVQRFLRGESEGGEWIGTIPRDGDPAA
jgi:phospholipid/cholesterol/gamma-HCH transport system ATP-binding protein